MDLAPLTLFALLAAAWRWKVAEGEAPEVNRLRTMLSDGKLIHPFRSGDSTVANFRDLAEACAQCCGVSVDDDSTTSVKHRIVDELTQLLGGTKRSHVILILCDGMGNNILDRHLKDKAAILHRFNRPNMLRSVFPSTTPAALTTLATAQWPGQHGAPGWDLRQVQGCEYPGEPQDTVQLRVLASKITDVRTGQPVNYKSLDDVFLAKPWARSVRGEKRPLRQMVYINAYNGEEFPSWYQGLEKKASDATEFSSWQMGGDGDPFQATKIGETAKETLGAPEGSTKAIEYFASGIDAALSAIADAESQGRKSFIYLYTAHPDKHMHALGTDHQEVGAVVKGVNKHVERLWDTLSDRKSLLTAHDKDVKPEDSSSPIDAAVVVTADHGHVTVKPDEMIVLPETIVDCLEYANIGVFGKGRHAYLHCKSGLQSVLRDRWRSNQKLNHEFLLLTIEEASAHGLFGPEAPLLRTRPRLGDFVAIATTHATLVSPNEFESHADCCCGAHGSLLPEEMRIPFIFMKR